MCECKYLEQGLEMKTDSMAVEVNSSEVRVDVSYQGFFSPMAIFCHGFPGEEKNRDIAESLFKRGFSTSVIKYRGVEDSTGEFSFSGATYDIKRSIDALKENYPFIDENSAIIGYSYGGLFSVNVAKDTPSIRNMVAISPVVDLNDFINDNDLETFFDNSVKKVRGRPNQWLYEQQELLAFSNPTDSFIYMSPYETNSRNLNVPQTMIEHLSLDNLLVVHGTEDKEVRPKHGKTLYAQAKCNKEFHAVHGANHTYSVHREELINIVTDYLTKIIYEK